MKNSHTKEKRTTTKSTPLLRTNSLGKSVKKSHSGERKEPYNTLNRTEQTTSKKKMSKKWPQEIKEKKRNTLSQRSPTKVLKESTQLLRAKRLEESFKRLIQKREGSRPSNILNRTKQNNTEQQLSEK